MNVVWVYSETPEWENRQAGDIDLCDVCFDRAILSIAHSLIKEWDEDGKELPEILSPLRRVRVED